MGSVEKCWVWGPTSSQLTIGNPVTQAVVTLKCVANSRNYWMVELPGESMYSSQKQLLHLVLSILFYERYSINNYLK